MKNNVNLIYGHQNTGKSKYYEKLIEEFDNILYFATLQEKDDRHMKIQQHRDRRSAKWVVLESVGDIERDNFTLINTIKEMKMPLYIMIDGLTNWCLFCANNKRDFKESAENVAGTIIHLTRCYDNVDWYLLDNKRIDYKGNPVREIIWDILFEKLTVHIVPMQLIEWRPQ